MAHDFHQWVSFELHYKHINKAQHFFRQRFAYLHMYVCFHSRSITALVETDNEQVTHNLNIIKNFSIKFSSFWRNYTLLALIMCNVQTFYLWYPLWCTGFGRRKKFCLETKQTEILFCFSSQFFNLLGIWRKKLPFCFPICSFR